MSTIRTILFPVLACIFFVSCDNSSNNACGSAWIGGEIVNPQRDHVVIYQSHKTIDTVPLDENNFFMYRLEGVEPGIYFFSHNEYQAVFIEPGDSIMLRVNTVEFDESLSYTGTGADRNNFMMDLFLLNEKENESMPEMYLLSPADFETRMDSLMSYRNMLYTNFKENRRVSKQFEEVAKASLNFDIYSKKELYLSANARKKVYNEDLNIPEHFFNHRKQIDMGNENLRSYYPYYRFLSFYLDNLAFEKYKDSSPYDRNSYKHNYHKIHLIDSLITN
ncbi:MAG: hypothetical protein KJO23_08115, partial [Bacteroidia bacterium]|nr:hypothetical protein [Bacteroidia bacterium]